MSNKVLLQRAIEAEGQSYPSGLSEAEIFEVFCANNILKNYDLTYEQVSDGIVDGPKDGGIDGLYCFINRMLICDDTDFNIFKSPVQIDVIIIQSKHQDSFKEAAVDKLSASLPMLFDLNQTPGTLSAAYNSDIIRIFGFYREAVGKLSQQFPTLNVKIFYCSKGDAANGAIRAKAEALTGRVNGLVNGPTKFEFLGADELYWLAQEQRRYVAELPTTNVPLFGGNSFVALCKISDYANFISDKDGSGALMTRLFEANVRDYQGDVDVNREIEDSLKNPEPGVDFWWLNNGVTIVADNAQFQNGRMIIENPLIVNGLQTSYELHRFPYLVDDSRHVLVRIIQESDPNRRDQIIKATNRQTAIKPSSLRATEPIHRRIEDYLAAHALYYDRRKNHYKNIGKPADRIISIDKLAQAVMTVLLSRPHDARARPTTLIKNDSDSYSEIFSENETTHPLDMYRVVAEILLLVERHFKSANPKIDRRYKNNLKFHTLMIAMWNAIGSKAVTAAAIAQVNPTTVNPQIIEDAARWVMAEFDAAGGDDRTAKDASFTDRLKANWTPS